MKPMITMTEHYCPRLGRNVILEQTWINDRSDDRNEKSAVQTPFFSGQKPKDTLQSVCLHSHLCGCDDHHCEEIGRNRFN